LIALRLLAVLAVLLVAGSMAAYLLTGEKRYVRFSWGVFKVTVGAALVVFALLIAERLFLIPG
jgi:hypothetical protein